MKCPVRTIVCGSLLFAVSFANIAIGGPIDANDKGSYQYSPLYSELISPNSRQARATAKATSTDIFIPVIIYDVGPNPEAVAIGDLNGDGRNDVVMTAGHNGDYNANPEDDYHLFIYTQNILGRLAVSQKILASGTYQRRSKMVGIGDLNNDQRPDIVVGTTATNFEIFYQGLDGSYSSSVIYPHSDIGSFHIGDLNNDGLDDIITDNGDGETISIWHQNKSGTLDAPVSYPVPHFSPAPLDIGDVNNDGLTDIVVAGKGGNRNPNLFIFHQNIAGGFDGPVSYSIYIDANYSRPRTQGMTIADLNDDGRNDIAFSFDNNIYPYDDKIAVFYQNVNNGLDRAVSNISSQSTGSIAAADMNQDGLDDLVIAYRGGRHGIYFQNLNGRLDPEVIYYAPFSVANNHHDLALGDVNNDGKYDVVISDDERGLATMLSKKFIKKNYCTNGSMSNDLFLDDLEDSGPGNWVTASGVGTNHWTGCMGSPDIYCNDRPNSGVLSLFGHGSDTIGDSWVEMTKSVTLPSYAYFEFQHTYVFEYGDYGSGEVSYDGGVIEYSVDNGATWNDAGLLIDSGQAYTNTLTPWYDNPLGGRSAFTGSNGGMYLPTRLNLSTLYGKNVKLRFRIGSDSAVASRWWNIDDVALYSCIGGKSDVVIDFGGVGLWAHISDSGWIKLNNTSPDHVITADVDGNDIDDVIADFSSTLGGIFIKRRDGAWSKLHNSSSQSMAAGDLDGNGSDDIVIDFGGLGLWARMNDSSWLKLNNTSPDQFVITDMDGNGQDDVIADYGSTFGGIFVIRNRGTWSKLHNNSALSMTTGDLDGNGSGDVIINFGGTGLWARMNNAFWLKLHHGSPENVVAGDVDGNGADDVVASFGSTIGGVWQKLNLGGWSKLNNSAPDQMVMGDMDANGQSDLIGAFNSTLGGIFVRRNNGAWQKLHNNNPDDLAVGNLDGD